MSDSSSATQLSGPTVMKLMKELKQLTLQPPEGITIHINDENISLVHFDLIGPADTPFEGGFYRIALQLPSDYPNTAPKGWFLTKIFHPNVNFKTGEICVSTLKKDWVKTLGLRHVMIVIRCLLIEPNPESALNEDAGKLLLENYADYFQRAKMMTKVHAKQQATAGEVPATETNTASSSSSIAASASTATTSAITTSATPEPTLGEEENTPRHNLPLTSTATLAGVGADVVKKPAVTATATVNATTSNQQQPLPASMTTTTNNTTPALTRAVSLPGPSSAAAAKATLLKKKSLKRL